MQLYNPNEEITSYNVVENELDLTDKHLKEELGQVFKKDQSLRLESLLLKKKTKRVLKVFMISDEEESDEKEKISLNMKNLFEKIQVITVVAERQDTQSLF